MRYTIGAVSNGVVVTATRRRADGGPSARSLLISVLGQWVGPSDTPVWNTTLINALDALGIEERAARQAVNRTAADGWLEGESVGRYTRWRLTPSGRRLVKTSAQRLSRSFTPDLSWNGRFLLLALTGTAPDRAARDRLATGLDFEGFGVLSSGLWIAADLEARSGVEALLESVAFAGQVLMFSAETIDGAETPAEVVAMAWDLDTAAAAHQAFLGEFDGVVPADDREAFALRTRLAHEWRHLLSVDPALPPQLLPADWAGTRAREVFHRCYAAWAEPANLYYTTLSDEAVMS
jgi:phenylacetic acid degradation operon negative regulatory protein